MLDHWLNRVSPDIHHGGHRQFRAGVINPWRIINDTELFIFDKGEATMAIDDKGYSYPAPWFIIIPPGRRHISRCISKRVDVYWCHFNWEGQGEPSGRRVSYGLTEDSSTEFSYAPEFVPKGILCGPVGSREALSLHQGMIHCLSGTDLKGRLTARAIFLRELIEILTPEETLDGREREGERLVEALREKLTELAHRPFNRMPMLRDALEELGPSYHHLERLFKQAFGISPNQYISLVRVERAKSLLGDPGLSVKQCAAKLGYSDTGYFIRFFRKQVGVSPQRWRR